MTRTGRPLLKWDAAPRGCNTFRRAVAIGWVLLALLATSSGAGASDPILPGPFPEKRALLPAASDSPNRPDPAATDRPRHDPIEILTDGDLVAGTTPLIDKGIRSGQGTTDDPYLISNWHISSNEHDGIYVYNTSRHLVIRDVTITQEVVRNQSVGIFVEQARNVVIEDVTIRGRQRGGVAVFDSPGEGLVTGDPVVIRNVTVVRGRDLPATSDGLWIEDSNGILIEQINVSGAFDSGVFVNYATATIKDSRFDLVRRLVPPSEYFTRYYRGTGILYTAGTVQVRNNTFVRMPYFVYPVAAHDTSPRSAEVMGNDFVPFDDGVGALVVSGENLTIQDNSGPVIYGVTGGNMTIEGNELKHLVVDGHRHARLNVKDNTFDGQDKCHSSAIDGYSTQGSLDDVENVPNVPQGWGSDSTCSPGLDVSAASDTSVDIVGNVFKRYPTTAVWLGGPDLELTGNAFYHNSFQDNDVDGGCHPVPIVVVKPMGSSAEAALNQNDILRSPRSECGVGLETDGPRYTIQQPDSPTGRTVMDGSRTDRRIDARNNYWGPVGPTVWTDCHNSCEGISDDARRLAVNPPPKNQTIDFDPWSTTPNVLSESFVQDYFANHNTGNLVPTLHPAAVLTTLLLAALATAARNRD